MNELPAVHPRDAAARPRYLVGVDGGGSGTRARLADIAGREIGLGAAGPSALGQGLEQAWDNVRLAIAAAFADAGLAQAPESQIALGLGLSGAHSPARGAAFVQAAPRYARLRLDSDGGSSLRGAHRGGPGAVIAAGTGSVGEALHADGRRVTVGGWGFGVGDEGSGAWLGQHAMRVAQRALDGREPAGVLAQAVWQQLGGQREALQDWCARAGQQAYATLAPLVFDAAAADAAAQSLLDLAVAELAALAQALDPQHELPLVIVGSIGLRLRPQLPLTWQQRCVEPAGDSAQGALWSLMDPAETRP